MSLQFNNRRRRRRLKRRVIIIIRILLAMLVLGLIVYGSINVYSYFNNKNKEIVHQDNNLDELPTDLGTNENPEDETNSNSDSSDNILNNNNNIGSAEQDKGAEDTDTSVTDNPDTDKPEDNETNNDVTGNSGPGNNVPDKSEEDKEQTSGSDSKDKDNNKTDIKKDESYFDDAVFIGDSRTEGLKLYSGLKNATFYAEKGLDVSTIFKKTININGSNMTIIDALHKQTFGKVYINLGVNELGWPYDSEFIKHYEKVIDAIKEAQPNAKIYLQSIIHISREKDKNPPQYFSNKTIVRRNKLLKKLAKEKEINYIDVNEVLIDEKGYLIEGASTDGIHLNKEYCLIWKDYLIKHIAK